MTIHEHDGKGLLARNSLFNLAGQILPLLVGVVTIPYIVKGLGTVGFGILSITWMVLGYFSMFDLGLSRATTKFVAAHLSPDKIDRVPALIWTSLALQLGLGFAGGASRGTLCPVRCYSALHYAYSFCGRRKDFAPTPLCVDSGVAGQQCTSRSVRGCSTL